MFVVECFTCDESEVVADYETANEVFVVHADQKHEVELRNLKFEE